MQNNKISYLINYYHDTKEILTEPIFLYDGEK